MNPAPSQPAGLFDALPAAGRRKPTIDERFAAYDAANPEVWTLFVRFANELRNAGHARHSADAVLHRIRWHYAMAGGAGDGGFRINDHFSSRYSRKLVEQDPTFATFFEARRLRSAGNH